jgi:hypothetical protein
MIKIILVFLLLSSSIVSAANWIITGATDDSYFYYDADTMVKNSDIVTVWKKMNTVEKNGKSYSWLYREELDCKKKMKRTIAGIKYSKPDGKGDIVPSEKPNDSWKSIPPGSVGESAQQDICKAATKIQDHDSWFTKFTTFFK